MKTRFNEIKKKQMGFPGEWKETFGHFARVKEGIQIWKSDCVEEVN